VAVADIFLKVHGVTGEAGDADHKGEIDVVSWSWEMESPTDAITGSARGRAVVGELKVVKKVDASSPTLMSYLRTNKVVPQACLTVRKAGEKPLEYFRIELQNSKITSLKIESEGDELMEHLQLGFSKMKVVYTPQGKTGGSGGGKVEFETDAHAGA
jgi:type VI secretion system secreted protein Hcp